MENKINNVSLDVSNKSAAIVKIENGIKIIGSIEIPNLRPYLSINFPEIKFLKMNSKNSKNPS